MSARYATVSPATGLTCGISPQDSQVGVVCALPGPTDVQYRAWATCPRNQFIGDYGWQQP